MKCSYKLSTFALFFSLVGFFSTDVFGQECVSCPTAPVFRGNYPLGQSLQLRQQCAASLVNYFEGYEAVWNPSGPPSLRTSCECKLTSNGIGVECFLEGRGAAAGTCLTNAAAWPAITFNSSLCDAPECEDALQMSGNCDSSMPIGFCLEDSHCEYERDFSASSCGHGGDNWWASYEWTGDYCLGADDCENEDGTIDLDCKCKQDPDYPGCKPFCEQYPDSPLCDDPDFCDENPNHPHCIDDDDDKGFCDRNPDHPGCAAFCDRNPWHPACVEVGDFCEENPYHVRCNDEPDDEDFCEKYPFHPVCIDPGEFCDDYPYHPSCQDDRPFCERYPESPACSNNLCEEFPEHPYCDDEEYCDKFPGDPLCLDCGNPDNEDPRCHVPYCDLYPDTPECRDTGDFCQQPGNQHSMWCIGCDDPAQSQQPWCQNQIPCYGDGCNEETGGFAIGSSCDKGQPICELESDPVGCALLWQVWYSSCGPEAGGSIPFGDPGLVVAGLPTDAEIEGEIGQMIDQFLLDSDLGEVDLSDAIVGDSFLPQTCPSPINLSLMGASVDVPLDPFCELATTVRPLVIAMFAIFSALIVIRGIW